MSKFKQNALTKSASGSFGDQFQFRQVNGETILGPLPKKSGVVSEKQARARQLFVDASAYGKSVQAHEGMKAEYEEIAKHKNLRGGAKVAAMTDYLTSPKLLKAYAHQFDGKVGFKITIVLKDNYKGKEMSVSVANKDGTIMESGQATFRFGDTAWSYTTTVPYADLDGVKVQLTVKDRIGNITSIERIVNS